jgi:hypothetical protein
MRPVAASSERAPPQEPKKVIWQKRLAVAEAVHAYQSIFYWLTIKAAFVGSAMNEHSIPICQDYEILRGIVALQRG